MDKAPDAYRTISEVAEDLDLPQHVLRFWETRFGQIKPLKRGGGRRYYRPDDVELLKGIRHLLYKEGYTIKGVQRILKEQGARAVQSFARDLAAAEPQPMPAALPPVAAAAPPPPVLPAPPEPVAPPPRLAPVFEQPPAPMRGAAPPKPGPQPGLQTQHSLQPQLELPVALPLVPAAAAIATPLDAIDPNPALENWRPDSEDETRPDSGIAITLEQGPPPPPPPQVSMFRGGLARGEGVVPATPPPPRPVPPDVAAAVSGSVSPAAREAMRYALDELVSCRAMIDRVLARRQTA